jgi:hypothetical protein
MPASQGLSGLPSPQLITSPAVQLSFEFVRRTDASAAALTYFPEFSSDLIIWQPATTPVVTAINSRWERVQANDPEPGPKRFARLRVALTD